MSQSSARMGFLAIWAGLLGLITLLDLVGLFVYLPYGISVVLLLLIAQLPLTALWKSGHSRLLWGVLVLGLVWLLVLPSIPWNADKALLVHAAKIRVGMTPNQVMLIMAEHAHPGTLQLVQSGQAFPQMNVTDDQGHSHEAELRFYAFGPPLNVDGNAVVVDFTAGRVDRVWIDLD